MKKYVVVGNPIDHSLSPEIHNYWFKKNKIDAIYEKVVPDINKIESIIKDIDKNDTVFYIDTGVASFLYSEEPDTTNSSVRIIDTDKNSIDIIKAGLDSDKLFNIK